MSAVYKLFPVPYQYYMYIEDNEKNLRDLLFKECGIRSFVQIQFGFYENTNSGPTYQAMIKTKHSEELKTFCYDVPVYDVEIGEVVQEKRTIHVKAHHELTRGKDYVFDVARLCDLVWEGKECKDIHPIWKGKILDMEQGLDDDWLTVEAEDKKVHRIAIDKKRTTLKKIHYLTEKEEQLPTYVF